MNNPDMAAGDLQRVFIGRNLWDFQNKMRTNSTFKKF